MREATHFNHMYCPVYGRGAGAKLLDITSRREEQIEKFVQRSRELQKLKLSIVMFEKNNKEEF